MLRYLFLFSLLIPAVLATAQEGKISGLIITGNERLNNANIKNINNQKQTTSDDRGEFEIAVSKGDTLIIAKASYISDTLLVGSEESLIIQLKRPATMLKEVNINSTAITPASVYDANKKEYKQIYFLGDNSHIFTVPTIIGPVIGLGVNIDKLNNALGKTGRNARKLQRTLTTDYKNRTVDRHFNTLAASVTGYKGTQLSDFIRDNRPSYEMISKSSDYDIVKYIKKKLSEGQQQAIQHKM